LYLGSFVRVHDVVAVDPAVSVCASAPKVATGVDELVEAVWLPLQGVATPVAPQVYLSASPAVGGVVTEGPLAGLKSLVTFRVMVPLPVDWVVRTK
jgi:hypothetical protein